MQGVLMLGIVLAGIVLALAVIGGTILLGIKILKGDFSRKGQKSQMEETKIIQEVHQGLSRMEQRVEALETIILASERKDRTP